MKLKTPTSGQLLIIASRILISAYNSPHASLQDCIDAEYNFTYAERNHRKVRSRPAWFYLITMHSRAEHYLQHGVNLRGDRVHSDLA
jgi:hypothetical protein